MILKYTPMDKERLPETGSPLAMAMLWMKCRAIRLGNVVPAADPVPSEGARPGPRPLRS